jgi:putative SOS response-associated peptidase YedK
VCAHYEAVRDPLRSGRHFQAAVPDDRGKDDLWPGYPGLFIRRPQAADAGDEAVPDREALTGVFGLLPHWARDESLARRTYNARSETAHEKPSFRDAWKQGRRCIIPADWIYEPDWRSGKAVPTRIFRRDGEPMGIAGLWSTWKNPAGETVRSYTMLTVNADEHALMRGFHKPGDEKRMVAILPTGAYGDWLRAPPGRTRDFMHRYPAERLEAEAAAAKPAER